MEPGGSMSHLQGLSNNPYHEPNESTQFLIFIPISLRYILILSSHLLLGLTKGLFHIGLLKKLNLWLTAPKGATSVN